MLRVRFAPSPTGYLHIGGARTCLFNWLYARHCKGTFVLRIEDTDVVRSKPEYLEEILNSLKWLGMDWDELYYQSQRFDLYRQYAGQLVKEDKAYEKEGAVFFKYDFREIEFQDIIRGKITFHEMPKEEEVIIKSDGSPTYNFCCVIDDALLKINCVIRGEDHISNTPKQILMYKALNFEIPMFAHVPLILSPDGGRLSKRHGATAISEYRQMGYLPEAIVNYLLLLGWSPGDDKEVICLSEAVKLFDAQAVNKTGAAFSLDKLNWFNGEYIRRKTVPELAGLIKENLKDKDIFSGTVDISKLEKVTTLLQPRLVTLRDFYEKAYSFYRNDYQYSPDVLPVLEKKMVNEFNLLVNKLSAINQWLLLDIEKEFRATAETLKIKVKELVHPTRIALSGKKDGPGLFETMEVLGQTEVIGRLKRLIAYWG
jgi:glutamyl-tRNA synthetase